jgi:hypothetical protein
MSELTSFARIAGDRPFQEWLENQQRVTLQTMASATDPYVIGRAQGRYQLLAEILERLEKAKKLR